MTELNLERLIRACQNGDENSRKALYDYFSPRLLGVCYRYARSKSDAEDILQESFLKAFHKLHQLKDYNKAGAWLKRIVINEAISFYKKEQRFFSYDDNFNSSLPIIESYDLFKKIELDDIMRIVQTLPDRMRLVLNLYAIEGFSHKEIAKQLGISIGTSKSNLFDARKRVKQALVKISGEVK